MLRTKHAIAVQQQRGDADEFPDFHQSRFVFLVAYVLGRRRGELGDVGERLAAFFGKRRIRAGGKAETAEEAATPVEQAATALGQAGIVVGDQQVEREVARVELFERMVA